MMLDRGQCERSNDRSAAICAPGSHAKGTFNAAPSALLLYSAFGLALGLVGTSGVWLWPEPWQRGLHQTIVYVLTSLSYGFFSVPYIALASRLSVDTRARAPVLDLRMVVLMGGLLVGAAGGQYIVGFADGGLRGYAVMDATLGLVALISALPVAVTATHWQMLRPQNRQVTQVTRKKVVFADGLFVRLTLMQLTFSAAVAELSVVLPFVVRDLARGSDFEIGHLFLSWIGSALVAAPHWPALTRLCDRVLILKLIIASFAAIASLWAFVGSLADTASMVAALAVLVALLVAAPGAILLTTKPLRRLPA